MPLCKFCNIPFAWGNADGKWVALVPVGEEGELDRKYQDEDGLLRSAHADVCQRIGGKSVRVSRLAKDIPASQVLPTPAVVAAEDAHYVGAGT